jgi:ABC-type amino acid transport substrate-binding protein
MKLTLLLLITLSYSVSARDAINVTVGMYPFSPFVESKVLGGDAGMTVDLIIALNKLQKKYHFKAIQIPPKRRYQSYKDGHYDVIFYENKAWGWQNIEINESQVYQTGGEVYVALNKRGRGQDYFDDFSDKRMMGILGFHYGFADFNTDELFLKKQFQMQLSHDNDKNLAMLLKERGDIVVLTKAYLHRYLLQNPQLEKQLLISDRLDQEYNHTVLVRPKIKPTVEEVNHMLEALDSTGALKKLLIKYGIPP